MGVALARSIPREMYWSLNHDFSESFLERIVPESSPSEIVFKIASEIAPVRRPSRGASGDVSRESTPVGTFATLLGPKLQRRTFARRSPDVPRAAREEKSHPKSHP